MLKSRRLAVAGVAAFAVLGVALTGCSGTKPTATDTGGSGAKASGAAASGAAASGGAGSAAPAGSPKEAVLASVKQLGVTSYKFSIKSTGMSGQGQADPAHKKFSIDVTGSVESVTMKIGIIQLGADSYVKLDMGEMGTAAGIPAGWMHLDSSAIKSKSGLGIGTDASDPTDSAGLLTGLVDATKVDDRHYTATIDLTKATGDLVDADTLDKLGDKASTMKAAIVLDDQGRLSDLKIDMSAVASSKVLEVSYSDYGVPVTVAKPSGKIIEAPDSVRQLFSD